MSNAFNMSNPCGEKEGLHWQEEQVWGDGDTWAQGEPFKFQENANIRHRTSANPVLIRMPGTGDTEFCGTTANPFGYVYTYSTRSTNLNVNTGGGFGAGGRSGVTNFAFVFPFPVDMALNLGSFNCNERFYIRTLCNGGFIAGNGSSLATNPAGYQNTWYCDGNAGGSICIYRDVTVVTGAFLGAGGLSCSATPRFLKTPNIIRGDVRDGNAVWPPPSDVQAIIQNWPYDGNPPQVSI